MSNYFDSLAAGDNLWLLLVFIVLPFIATLIIVPWLIIRLPADYFSVQKRKPMPEFNKHPLIRMVLLVLKNLLGLIVFVVGVAMLVLPGQGVLTMLIGMMLLDFPGKFRCERWIVSFKPVLRSVNWIRGKKGHAPFIL